MNRTRLLLPLILLLGAALARAEVVDRIVATVGEEVVTWSELQSEASYQAFRAGEAPAVGNHDSFDSLEDSEKTVQTLIDRILLEQALGRSPFEVPEEEPAPDLYQELVGRFAGAGQLQSEQAGQLQTELRRYGISEAELRQRLRDERRLMVFVSYALQPQIRLQPEQIAAYYRGTLVPELEHQPGLVTIPALDEVRVQIQGILTQRELNRLLDQWLVDLRQSTKIRIWNNE